MDDLHFFSDFYPRLDKLLDPTNRTNECFFQNSMAMLSGFDKPFAHPHFCIGYNNQSGVDASAIMNEWIQAVLVIMNDPSRRLFVQTYHSSNRRQVFLPAEFVDPEIMYVFGLLIGKCWQKGIQLPMDLHPLFWAFLASKNVNHNSGSVVSSLIPGYYSVLSNMKQMNVEEMKNAEYPLLLTVSDLLSTHCNYRYTCADETFQPTDSSSILKYCTDAENLLFDCLYNGRKKFRAALSLFVQLDWIDGDDARWISSSLHDNTPIVAKCLMDRVVFGDAQFATTIDESFGQVLSFADAFRKCVMEMSEDELERLLLHWTGSTRLPVGGYAMLSLSVQCLVGQSEGLVKSSSCLGRLYCPSYNQYGQMSRSLKDSINLSYSGGFHDEPADD